MRGRGRDPAGYDRLVNRLIDLERYGEAERWIRKGILATGKKYPVSPPIFGMRC